MARQGDPLRTVQETEVWECEQMVYAQSSICLGEWDSLTPPEFWDTNGSRNLGQTTKPYNNQKKKKKKKKRTSRIADVAVPADLSIKLKESEKKEKYLDLWKDWIKTVEHESDGYTNCIGSYGAITQRIETGTGRLGNKGKGGGPSKLQPCWDWQEYWEGSCTLKENMLPFKLQWENID